MGFDLIKLSWLLYVFGKTGLSKQYRPRSKRGVWSGPILFSTYLAFLHTFTLSKLGLLKRNITEKRNGYKFKGKADIPNLSNFQKNIYIKKKKKKKKKRQMRKWNFESIRSSTEPSEIPLNQYLFLLYFTNSSHSTNFHILGDRLVFKLFLC